MFNRFVLIKPNMQKFTLLIEKVTFQEKQYKIEYFSTKFGFNRLLKNKAICIRRKIFIFFSLKKNKMAQGRGWPKAGYLPLLYYIIVILSNIIKTKAYPRFLFISFFEILNF